MASETTPRPKLMIETMDLTNNNNNNIIYYNINNNACACFKLEVV